ncbi:MAG: hypothetical protein HPY52_13375 [Firmicutes bacterium]|nr:hypothetical protein [Bacillota bacterium]
MGIFAKLFSSASSKPAESGKGLAVANDRNAVWIYVKCKKCGEIVPLRLRKTDEIQRDCDNVCSAPGAVFFVHKEVMGKSTKCFNRMDLFVEFDCAYRVVGANITNGELVSREEYLKQTESDS